MRAPLSWLCDFAPFASDPAVAAGADPATFVALAAEAVAAWAKEQAWAR